MGIGEIRKLSAVVKDDVVHAVFRAMGPYLCAAITQINLLEEEEADLVQPLNLFESPSQ